MPTYKGFVVYQRAGTKAMPLFVFSATATEILSWAKVLQTAKVPGAAQRLDNVGHVRSIRAFVSASAENIIPTSATLAIPPGLFILRSEDRVDVDKPGWAPAELEVSDPISHEEDGKPAFVIDGQHRLKALAELREPVQVVATIMLGANHLDRALNFVVINNKAKRVSSDLVRGIVTELEGGDQTELKRRLVAVGLTLGSYPSALDVLGNNRESPFVELIDWDINRDGTKRIKPQALESSLKVILANLRSPDRLEIDDAVDLLSAMWRGVRDGWQGSPKSWRDESSKLVDKAGLVAVTEFLVDRVNHRIEDGFDVSDPTAVESFAKAVMGVIPASFWLMPWTKSELDTSAGRDIIKKALAAVRTAVASQQVDPFENVPLVSRQDGGA